MEVRGGGQMQGILVIAWKVQEKRQKLHKDKRFTSRDSSVHLPNGNQNSVSLSHIIPHAYIFNKQWSFWQNLAKESICIETDWIIKETEHAPQPVICLS